MTYLFLDTNIFLHYKFFIEIPWQKIVSDEYQIVLPPVVMDELDKHKRHQNPKIASRAKKVLSKFEDIVNDTGSFPLKYIFKRPSRETFDLYQLDRNEQDDCILATILEFKVQYNDASIKLISNDTGPRFRAASLSIAAVKLDDEYLVPIEKTEEQKQIQKLTQEISAYKNRIPKLSLCFLDGSNFYSHHLRPLQETSEEFLSSSFAALQELYPLMVWEDPEIGKAKYLEDLKSQLKGNPFEMSLKSSVFHSGFGTMYSISKDQVESYNKDLDDFFEKYKLYVKNQFALKVTKSLSLPIDIKIKNTGNVPALDIDIWLHFPDGFELFSTDEYPKKTMEPTPPYRPKHRYDTGPMFIPNIGSLYNSDRGYAPRINFNEPTIRKTNSFEVDIHYKSLKHFQSHDLDRLIVVYPSFEEIINFTIDYRLVISNVPEPVCGQLSVRAEVISDSNLQVPPPDLDH
jgi:rRNA-processing protein FCF1